MNDVAKVVELARDIRVGMLTTIDEHGRMVSRPMAQQEVEFDGDLWFFAERNSRKIAHIRTTPQVGVTLTDSSTWLSVRGAAEVVEDTSKARELWNSWVEAWLPQGARGPVGGARQGHRRHRGVLGHARRPDRLGGEPRQGEGDR